MCWWIQREKGILFATDYETIISFFNERNHNKLNIQARKTEKKAMSSSVLSLRKKRKFPTCNTYQHSTTASISGVVHLRYVSVSTCRIGTSWQRSRVYSLFFVTSQYVYCFGIQFSCVHLTYLNLNSNTKNLRIIVLSSRDIALRSS